MRINKYIFGLVVAMAGLFVSCDTENEGVIYTAENEGVTFASSALQGVEVPASNPLFTVDLLRGDTKNALSGSVSAKGTIVVGENADGEPITQNIEGIKVSNYSFAPGENITSVNVDISPLPVGYVMTLTLTIDDEKNVAVSGKKAATMKCSKAYEWKSLGKGKYIDNWVECQTEVEIFKADGFDRYRVMKPYESYLKTPEAAASWENWISTSSAEYIEFWTQDGSIYFDDYYTGLNYQGDSSQPIYVCHPSGWSSLRPNIPNNKWIDAKTAQFAPYYYIDGLGGWNYTGYDGVIYVILP